jgi:hypothetical protein
MLALRERKVYLIYFPFKVKEIKSYTLFMNWLIWEKMFTYFYNKFRSVNCMHYTKCSVNSLLLISHNCGCCRRPVASWITILLQRTLFTMGGDLQICFCVIFCATRHHAQTHATFGTHTHRALSVAARWTEMQRRGLRGGQGLFITRSITQIIQC